MVPGLKCESNQYVLLSLCDASVSCDESQMIQPDPQWIHSHPTEPELSDCGSTETRDVWWKSHTDIISADLLCSCLISLLIYTDVGAFNLF